MKRMHEDIGGPMTTKDIEALGETIANLWVVFVVIIPFGILVWIFTLWVLALFISWLT